MITLSRKHLAFLCIACMAAGWWLTSSPSSPIVPDRQPQRPVLRWIAKAAKNALWFMLIAEQPPQTHEAQYAHARVGADGEPLLNHGAGW